MQACRRRVKARRSDSRTSQRSINSRRAPCLAGAVVAIVPDRLRLRCIAIGADRIALSPLLYWQ